MARGTRGAQDLLKNLSRHLPSSLEALHTEVTVGDRRAVTPDWPWNQGRRMRSSVLGHRRGEHSDRVETVHA